MMKWAALILLALGGPAFGQATSQTFSNYVNGLPTATTPTGSDVFYILQSGTSKKIPFLSVSQAVTPNLVISTTAITGGTTGECLIDSAGFLGITPCGSGSGFNQSTLWLATGATTPRALADVANDHGINTRNFGAIGDGSSHPLSGIYANLAAAQAVYPFVSDLTQEVDWAATQAAINYGFANGGQNAFCPAVPANGAYLLSNPIQVMNSPLSNTNFGNSAWVSGTTYSQGNGVLYNGVNWTSNGSGNIGNPPTSVSGYPANLTIASNSTQLPFANVTVTSSTTTVNLTGHGFAAGQALIFFPQTYTDITYGSPALPGGLSANTVYYVLSAGLTSNTFEVSATPGGSAITFSNAGSGVITISTAVWTAIAIGSPDFSNRADFIGDPGQNVGGGNQGCYFKYLGYLATAIQVGAYNGNLIQSIRVDGPGATLGDYRCQMPSSLDYAGIGNVNSGAGTHVTTFDKVISQGFSNGWSSTIGGGGGLGDSNTFLNGSYNSNCTGLAIYSQEAFINSAYDVTLNSDNVAIQDTRGVGFNAIGGNHSSSGVANGFAVTSVSVTNIGNRAVILATVTSPDGYLTYPMCGYNQQCTYGTVSVVTQHFGVVPFSIIGFDPATSVINLEINSDWIAPYQNTCCGPDFATDLGAITKLYAAENVTTYQGSVSSKGAFVENGNTPTTLMASFTGFNASPSRVEDMLLDSEASGADNVCCNSNPSDSNLAKFYAQQNIPFVVAANLNTVIDNLGGGFNIKTWDRVLFEGGSTGAYGEFRHTSPAVPDSGGNGVIPGGPGLLWNQRFSSSDTFDGSFNGNEQTNNNWMFGNGATGGGLWDTGGPWVSGAWTSADQWKSAGWGVSKFIGSRPAFDASPCILPSQAAALATTLTITFSSNLQYINLNNGGSGYQNGDVVTLVGGSVSSAPSITVTSVGGGGAITGFNFNNNSNAYTAEVATSFTSSGGHGSNAIWVPASLPTQPYYVNYSLGYPMLYGGTIYHICDYKGSTQTHYAIASTNQSYSYFTNLTTSNVPNLSWSSYSASPIIYMNPEALELMFPGLVITLTGTGGSGCPMTPETFIITEVNPTLGYVKILNAGQNGTPYLPQWGQGNTCTGTIIGQAGPNLVNPY